MRSFFENIYSKKTRLSLIINLIDHNDIGTQRIAWNRNRIEIKQQYN